MPARFSSEETLRYQNAIVDSSDDAILVKTLDGIITSWNLGAQRVYGYTAEEAIGQPISMLLPEGRPTEFAELVQRLARGDSIEHFETQRRRKDGTPIDVEVKLLPIRDSDGRIVGASSIGRDITKSKQREKQLERANRTLRALTNVNQAMLHAADEKSLLGEVCKTIHRDCGYALVWTGFAEHDAGKTLRPIAHAGIGQSYVENVCVSWSEDDERGRGPAGIAIRTLRPYRCRDIAADPKLAPWREAALAQGFASVLVLPLAAGEQVFGALLVYSQEKDSFPDEEVNLLEELAADLAFGISSLRTRSAAEQAEEALRQHRELLRVTLDSIGDGVLATDTAGNVTFLNPVAAALTGWDAHEALGQPARRVFQIVNEQSGAPAEDIVARVLREGRAIELANHTAVAARDGRQIPIEDSAAPIKDNSGRVIGVVVVFHDVTEKRRGADALRENEAQLRLALNANRAGMWTADLVTERRVLSPELQRLYGFKPGEFDGTPEASKRPVVAEDRERVVAAVQAAAQSGELEVDFRYTRLDSDEVRWMQARGIVLEDEQGKPVRMIGVNTDITERKRAEQAMGESLERLQRVLEVETVGVMFWDLTTGRMVDANEAFLKLMGYNRSQVEAGELTWEKLTPPEYLEVSSAEVKKFLATGRVGPYEKEYYCGDGTKKWLLFAGSALGGNRCVEFCIDITDRKEAERALREGEQRLRLAQQAASIGAFEWNRETGVNTWSPELEAMYGLAPGEFGRTQAAWEQLVHPEDRAAAAILVERAMETGEPTEGEWRCIWPDGSLHTILGRFQFFYDEDRKPLRLTGVNIDITERKRAEEALQKSETRFRALFEGNHDAVFLTVSDGTILSANAAACAMFGMSEEELCRAGREAIVDQDDPRKGDALEERVRTGGISKRELRFVRKNGERFTAEVDSIALPGSPPRNFILMHDISERQQAHEALLRSEKLALQREQLQALAQQIGRAREEERTRVSRDLHDQIGQILTAIKMDLKWISKREADATLVERLKGSMELLNEGVQSVRTICSGLRPGILDDLGLSAAIEWHGNEFSTRTGIGCQMRLDAEGLTISTDQTTAFFRIFQECLTNISRHAEATRVEVALFPREGDLTMEVAVNGKGFEEAKVPQSLGILGMQERARAFGGDLKVTSIPGAGTTVVVRIPLGTGSAQADRIEQAK